MRKLLSAATVTTGLLLVSLVQPASAVAPVVETFTTVNSPDAVDPCTGDSMVVTLAVTATTHRHARTMVVHSRATGSSGDYRLHHGNLINVVTQKKIEGRLVELYEGRDGSLIRVANSGNRHR